MIRSIPRRSMLFCIVTLLAATALFVPTPARADQAAIRVSPPRAQVGSSVLVTGRGFTPSAQVALTMSEVDGREGPELGRTQVDEKGAFHARVTVPEVPPGDYVVKAVASDQSADFTISVVDPGATYLCLGSPATIVGTNGDDVLFGTAGDDVIVGRGGNDVITGLGGHDRMCGGPGNDQVRSGDFAARDELSGGPGNDVLAGSEGNDWLEGDSGSDFLVGFGGHDRLLGGEGNDWLNGDGLFAVSPGSDHLDGGPGAMDLCDGGDGSLHADSFVNCEHVEP